jgi:hypothetical protein
MDRKTLLAGLGGVACGVILASIAWLFSTIEFGNVSKVDEPDVQILALELAYQEMLRNKPPMRETPRKEIIMFTRDGCVWCDRWLAVEAPKFRQQGYSIAFSHDHSYSVVPVFELNDGSSKKTITGYFTYESCNTGR